MNLLTHVFSEERPWMVGHAQSNLLKMEELISTVLKPGLQMESYLPENGVMWILLIDQGKNGIIVFRLWTMIECVGHATTV